jgi:hypothetical protein
LEIGSRDAGLISFSEISGFQDFRISGHNHRNPSIVPPALYIVSTPPRTHPLAPTMPPTPITIITGFLGSGKTTLILNIIPQLPTNYKSASHAL